MNLKHIQRIAEELGIGAGQVEAVAALLAEDATVPFIARYRKEATGSLDEVQIAEIRDRLQALAELEKRREAILKSLEERDLLTEELRSAVLASDTLAVLEDVYLPWRPKRRTRAEMAREKGLAPLAERLYRQEPDLSPSQAGQAFLNAEAGLETVEEALSGACDILAEELCETPETRQAMRSLFHEQGVLCSAVAKGKDKEGAKFRDYFDWSESVSKAPSHRILALFRGEEEKVLRLSLRPPEAQAHAVLNRLHIQGKRVDNPAKEVVWQALADGYRRLLAPAMETELRKELKERADAEAIRVFARNLRELLMAAPLGGKAVLGIDPGFRTGCKVVCLDRQGKLLHDGVIYPTQSKRQQEEAGHVVKALCQKFHIEAIAIGNGTAGRETEAFVRGLGLPGSVAVVMVNESGASVYSASKVARDEFPDKDLTVRGAVSIGRRLMDPLAELVKIDPKAIGVGQYQHDVDQSQLKHSLDDVVASCVNAVGVDVNTASAQLLTYVSGLGPTLAGNIVTYRDEQGPFASRAALKKVPRLGPKAFVQSAGFLRIANGRNPLDRSAVHPERYKLVDRMAADAGCSVSALIEDADLRGRIDCDRYVSEEVGRPTLDDIMEELAKPGRDPRAGFEVFSFDDKVHSLEDLRPGMKLPGIITNVTNFGAFVDIGVHQDGLVHISQLADTFVKDPNQIVKVQQKVQVTVLDVDKGRNRIGLSMRSSPAVETKRPSRPREEKRTQIQPEANTRAGGDWFNKALGKKR